MRHHFILKFHNLNNKKRGPFSKAKLRRNKFCSNENRRKRRRSQLCLPTTAPAFFLPSPTSRNHPSLPPSFAAAPVEDAFSQRPTVRSATTTSHSFSISLVRTTRHKHTHTTRLPRFSSRTKPNTQLAHNSQTVCLLLLSLPVRSSQLFSQ